MRLHIGAFVVGAILIGTAAGSGGAAAAGDTTAAAAWQQIVARADAEGTLVVYTSSEDAVNQAEQAAFNKAYPGIKLQYTRLSSSALEGRFASETQSGAKSADFIKVADTIMVSQQKSWFEALDSATIPALANLPARWSFGWYAQNMAFPYVATFNTDIVKTIPLSWKDLVDPTVIKLQGELGDPRQNPSFMAVFQALHNLYGDEYLTKLGKSYQFFSTLSTALQDVAAGQTGFSMPGGVGASATLINDGAPIKTSALSPTILGGNFVAIAANAQHPNAALVFLNWMFTPEGQAGECLKGQYAAVISQAVIGCPGPPGDAVSMDTASAQREASKLVALLGLE